MLSAIVYGFEQFVDVLIVIDVVELSLLLLHVYFGSMLKVRTFIVCGSWMIICIGFCWFDDVGFWGFLDDYLVPSDWSSVVLGL